MNKECIKFLRRVKRAFPIYRKIEKQFYMDFSSVLKEYVCRYPNCTQKDLIEQFGDPKDIVAIYYNNIDSDAYFRVLKHTQYIRRFFIACIIIIFFTVIHHFYVCKKNI